MSPLLRYICFLLASRTFKTTCSPIYLSKLQEDSDCPLFPNESLALDTEVSVSHLKKELGRKQEYPKPYNELKPSILEKRQVKNWNGNNNFTLWGISVNSWDGKQSPLLSAGGGKKSFNSWGGKRGFGSWGGKRDFSSWGGKRSFTSWGGKRDFDSLGEKRNFNSLGEKRGFRSWGGKRGFGSWGRKRDFSSWGGKRGFSSWGGKREVSSWGEKRNCKSRSQVDVIWWGCDIDIDKRDFNSWGGKRNFSS